jgi:hypothetical protein
MEGLSKDRYVKEEEEEEEEEEEVLTTLLRRKTARRFAIMYENLCLRGSDS